MVNKIVSINRWMIRSFGRKLYYGNLNYKTGITQVLNGEGRSVRKNTYVYIYTYKSV